MPMRSEPGPLAPALFAAALLAIAMFAVFDAVPQNIAQYSVIALPALAVSVPGKALGCCGASS